MITKEDVIRTAIVTYEIENKKGKTVWHDALDSEILRETYKRGFNTPDTKYLEKARSPWGWKNLLHATGGNFHRRPILREIFKALIKNDL